jgi:hypothetical protein
MNHRTTPNNITELKPNEIFVFGSNGDGVHMAGAAKYAKDNFGAKMWQGYGLQGQSFAINTMSGLPVIKDHVDSFLNFAWRNPDKIFLVTEIGCGIAGHTPESIATLFANCIHIENIYLPEKFWTILNNHK